jgi:hypothetical protein
MLRHSPLLWIKVILNLITSPCPDRHYRCPPPLNCSTITFIFSEAGLISLIISRYLPHSIEQAPCPILASYLNIDIPFAFGYLGCRQTASFKGSAKLRISFLKFVISDNTIDHNAKIWRETQV